jgi:AraC-like DNA-binding protein
LKDFLFSLLPSSDVDNSNNGESNPFPTCFDLRSQIPQDGTTLDDTDGDYHDGRMWDWQTCTDLIFVMGFSSDSMFPPKPASYEDTTRHCRERFGVTPRPYQLVEQWRFDDLTRHSYILFTNGNQDLWSGGSVTYNVSDTVLALNFPNGAHHSDLSHVGPSPTRDSPDVQAGFLQIQTILGTWLAEVKQVART